MSKLISKLFFYDIFVIFQWDNTSQIRIIKVKDICKYRTTEKWSLIGEVFN